MREREIHEKWVVEWVLQLLCKSLNPIRSLGCPCFPFLQISCWWISVAEHNLSLRCTPQRPASNNTGYGAETNSSTCHILPFLDSFAFILVGVYLLKLLEKEYMEINFLRTCVSERVLFFLQMNALTMSFGSLAESRMVVGMFSLWILKVFLPCLVAIEKSEVILILDPLHVTVFPLCKLIGSSLGLQCSEISQWYFLIKFYLTLFGGGGTRWAYQVTQLCVSIIEICVDCLLERCIQHLAQSIINKTLESINSIFFPWKNEKRNHELSYNCHGYYRTTKWQFCQGALWPSLTFSFPFFLFSPSFLLSNTFLDSQYVPGFELVAVH